VSRRADCIHRRRAQAHGSHRQARRGGPSSAPVLARPRHAARATHRRSRSGVTRKKENRLATLERRHREATTASDFGRANRGTVEPWSCNSEPKGFPYGAGVANRHPPRLMVTLCRSPFRRQLALTRRQDGWLRRGGSRPVRLVRGGHTVTRLTRRTERHESFSFLVRDPARPAGSSAKRTSPDHLAVDDDRDGED
jgi:hypothetical protein